MIGQQTLFGRGLPKANDQWLTVSASSLRLRCLGHLPVLTSIRFDGPRLGAVVV